MPQFYLLLAAVLPCVEKMRRLGKWLKVFTRQDPIRINNGGVACDCNLKNREVETGASLVSLI